MRYIKTFLVLLVAAIPVWLGATSWVSAQPEESISVNVEVSLEVQPTILRVTGKAYPYAFITFQDGGMTIGTETADSSGDFTKDFSAVTHGIHVITVFARDSAQTVGDSVRTELHVEAQRMTTLKLFLPPTITVAGSEDKKSVLIGGYTYPNALVHVFIDDGVHSSVPAGADGVWRLQIPRKSLAIGEHSVFAKSSLDNGEQSSPTARRHFTVTEQTILVPLQLAPGDPGTVTGGIPIGSGLRRQPDVRPGAGMWWVILVVAALVALAAYLYKRSRRKLEHERQERERNTNYPTWLHH